MSLPPGFLDELRTRVTLSSIVGKKVTWDMRKSNMAKGDFWAPCPFHQEKSASFHVDDRKGYYYCFGCHAKGDAVTFVKESENLSFIEAVTVLSGEAGMQMPARDPQAGLSVIESGAPIDLLFTDVVMPGPITSREMTRRAQDLLPGLAVLFTSGHTRDIISDNHQLSPDTHLLSKPYSPDTLLSMIRNVLEEGGRG